MEANRSPSPSHVHEQRHAAFGLFESTPPTTATVSPINDSRAETTSAFSEDLHDGGIHAFSHRAFTSISTNTLVTENPLVSANNLVSRRTESALASARRTAEASRAFLQSTNFQSARGTNLASNSPARDLASPPENTLASTRQARDDAQAFLNSLSTRESYSSRRSNLVSSANSGALRPAASNIGGVCIVFSAPGDESPIESEEDHTESPTAHISHSPTARAASLLSDPDQHLVQSSREAIRETTTERGLETETALSAARMTTTPLITWALGDQIDAPRTDRAASPLSVPEPHLMREVLSDTAIERGAAVQRAMSAARMTTTPQTTWVSPDQIRAPRRELNAETTIIDNRPTDSLQASPLVSANVVVLSSNITPATSSYQITFIDNAQNVADTASAILTPAHATSSDRSANSSPTTRRPPPLGAPGFLPPEKRSSPQQETTKAATQPPTLPRTMLSAAASAFTPPPAPFEGTPAFFASSAPAPTASSPPSRSPVTDRSSEADDATAGGNHKSTRRKRRTPREKTNSEQTPHIGLARKEKNAAKNANRSQSDGAPAAAVSGTRAPAGAPGRLKIAAEGLTQINKHLSPSSSDSSSDSKTARSKGGSGHRSDQSLETTTVTQQSHGSSDLYSL